MRSRCLGCNRSRPGTEVVDAVVEEAAPAAAAAATPSLAGGEAGEAEGGGGTKARALGALPLDSPVGSATSTLLRYLLGYDEAPGAQSPAGMSDADAQLYDKLEALLGHHGVGKRAKLDQQDRLGATNAKAGANAMENPRVSVLPPREEAKAKDAALPSIWQCLHCTFENIEGLGVCEACYNVRGSKPWYVEEMTETGDPFPSVSDAPTPGSPLSTTEVAKVVPEQGSEEVSEEEEVARSPRVYPIAVHPDDLSKYKIVELQGLTVSRDALGSADDKGHSRRPALLRQRSLPSNISHIFPSPPHVPSTKLLSRPLHSKTLEDVNGGGDDDDGVPCAPAKMGRQFSEPVTSTEKSLAKEELSVEAAALRDDWDAWRQRRLMTSLAGFALGHGHGHAHAHAEQAGPDAVP